jgi:hypothetical protein
VLAERRTLSSPTVERAESRMRARLQFLVQSLKFVFGQVLGIGEAIFRLADYQDQFGELQLQRHGVAILRVLDQEHHQERHDGGGRVDHQLPGVAVAEQRSGQRPDDDQRRRDQERDRLSHPVRHHAGGA